MVVPKAGLAGSILFSCTELLLELVELAEDAADGLGEANDTELAEGFGDGFALALADATGEPETAGAEDGGGEYS